MICGVDEAGRGPVIGPLVVCGVAVKTEDVLRKIGVKDSKKLTASRRETIAPLIREVAKVEVVEVSAEEIDALRESMTMNVLEARVFATIIERLSPEIAYLDAADANEAEFDRVVRSQMRCGARTYSRHKADELFPVVSAASVIAKVTRDARIKEIESDIGEPIGSGYTSDPKTISFMKNWIGKKGSCPPHTRKSWSTAKNLMMVNGLRKLESFEG
ncbi:MAG: ribonuclease HII [Thermoplasmata archaeon]|nr:ribonuclease HII [Thermoplasmata archaeon]